MKIISIVGKMGSGKTYTCSKIENELRPLGYPVIRLSLADSLKMFTYDVFGVRKDSKVDQVELRERLKKEYSDVMVKFVELSPNETDQNERAKYLISVCELIENIPEKNIPRYLLQKIGTDIVRKFVDKDFWTRRMIEKLAELQFLEFMTEGIVLIDDMRFDNEYKLILEQFFDVEVLRVERDENIICNDLRITTAEYKEMLNHTSEKSFNVSIPEDSIIRNEKDLSRIIKRIKEEL